MPEDFMDVNFVDGPLIGQIRSVPDGIEKVIIPIDPANVGGRFSEIIYRISESSEGKYYAILVPHLTKICY